MAKINPIQLQKHLKGLDYPADKSAVVEHARAEGADQDVLATLEQLPDQRFETPADISQAVGSIE